MTAEVYLPGMVSQCAEIHTSNSSACGTNMQENTEQSMCGGWHADAINQHNYI